MKARQVRKLFVALLFVAFASARADAASVIFELNNEFSGAQTPTGTPPFLRATFSDVMGGVELKLESLLNGATEFVNVWNFNLDPNLNPNLLSFAFQSGSPNSATINTGVNAFMADGDGQFDIQFDWPNGGAGRFNGSDMVTYLITSSEAISAASFDFLSSPAGGHGPFPTAAHVQGIGDGGSGWITIPEPTSGLLMLGALAGIVAIRRR